MNITLKKSMIVLTDDSKIENSKRFDLWNEYGKNFQTSQTIQFLECYNSLRFTASQTFKVQKMYIKSSLIILLSKHILCALNAKIW